MKQVVQNLRSGKVELREVPMPACGRGEVLVRVRASLISAGTERMVMEFAGKSMVGKAKERPDLVRKVMNKMSRDGVIDTVASVFARLEEPLPLGYSAAGEVVAVGASLAAEFKVGDRVACAGAGLANHAEMIAVPKNLVVKLPDGVAFTEGCYATLGAIALHGVRNAGVVLGDRVLVVGLGLVGQLVSQLCAAAGARVAAMDPNAARCKLAAGLGAALACSPDKMASAWTEFTDGRGFDSVLLCAASDSDALMQSAAEMARDRASVVLVGKVGTKFDYATYMKKELNVRVSRSYGPGRYDPAFEQAGMAYPVGFVPWTERENLGEVVRLMGAKRLDVAALTTHTFAFGEALKGYDLITSKEPSLGVVLEYGVESGRLKVEGIEAIAKPEGNVGVSLIGVGGFARNVILPALAGISGVTLRGVVSKGGLSSAHVQEKYGAAFATTDAEAVLKDKDTDAVMIMTRHNAHAAQAVAAIVAGKSVWVEKPLGLSLKEIERVETALAKGKRSFMVGFNRRYSPALVPLKAKMAEVTGPKQVLVRVNAGRIDGGWQHTDEGGGRLLGEVCHFTDLALWLVGSELVGVQAVQGAGQDDYSVTLTFADGSVATVFYSSEGDPASAKERVEVFGGGGVGVMDNYTTTTWSQGGRVWKLYGKPMLRGQEKGHAVALRAWLTGGVLPGVAELLLSSRVVLWAEESIKSGKMVRVS